MEEGIYDKVKNWWTQRWEIVYISTYGDGTSTNIVMESHRSEKTARRRALHYQSWLGVPMKWDRRSVKIEVRLKSSENETYADIS